MQSLLKVPLILFFSAAVIGIVLRWHQLQPIDGFVYPFWLHSHSHIMFLGWVFNALSVNFVVHFLSTQNHHWYKRIFTIINILIVCMLISFPLQGYGTYSILISTLHTVAVIIFIFRFFKDTKHFRHDQVLGFARLSLIFFLISALGPFALGGLMTQGMGDTPWYRLAVYYYLHFQYNGVFTFGVLALSYRLLEQRGISINWSVVKTVRLLFFAACFPIFALSAIWMNPGLLYNSIGFLAALAQLGAYLLFFSSIRMNLRRVLEKFSVSSRILLLIALFSFALKLVLQLVSAIPAIALLANEVRFYVMAYLHLVLIGMVSFFLLAWYTECQYIPSIKWYNLGMIIFGFAGSELAMVGVGFIPIIIIQAILVISSILLTAAIGGVCFSSQIKERIHLKS